VEVDTIYKVFTTQYVTGNIMPGGKQRSLLQLFNKHGELFDNAIMATSAELADMAKQIWTDCDR
jgi:hypothetical protein